MYLACRRCGRVALRVLLWAAAGPVPLCATVWAVAALYIDVRIAWLRVPLAVVYCAVLAVVWLRAPRTWHAALFTAAAFACVLAWWLSLTPSNHRDWQPDLARLAHADLDGTRLHVYNIRNCFYRTPEDYDVHYYDKTYDLAALQSVDFYMVYWSAPYMAHTMMSFGFGGGQYLCFSIETRKQKGQSYSALKGLFRQFELIYIAADERDVVRLRTNYRPGEEVYLFRLMLSADDAREILLSYINHMNALYQQPMWYNAITHNCTTSIRMQRAATDRAPWDWRMLANGYGDELLYERGIFITNVPLAELKARGHINARAKAAGLSDDFSQLIRHGVPGH